MVFSFGNMTTRPGSSSQNIDQDNAAYIVIRLVLGLELLLHNIQLLMSYFFGLIYRSDPRYIICPICRRKIDRKWILIISRCYYLSIVGFRIMGTVAFIVVREGVGVGGGGVKSAGYLIVIITRLPTSSLKRLSWGLKSLLYDFWKGGQCLSQ